MFYFFQENFKAQRRFWENHEIMKKTWARNHTPEKYLSQKCFGQTGEKRGDHKLQTNIAIKSWINHTPSLVFGSFVTIAALVSFSVVSTSVISLSTLSIKMYLMARIAASTNSPIWSNPRLPNLGERNNSMNTGILTILKKKIIKEFQLFWNNLYCWLVYKSIVIIWPKIMLREKSVCWDGKNLQTNSQKLLHKSTCTTFIV